MKYIYVISNQTAYIVVAPVEAGSAPAGCRHSGGPPPVFDASPTHCAESDAKAEDRAERPGISADPLDTTTVHSLKREAEDCLLRLLLVAETLQSQVLASCSDLASDTLDAACTVQGGNGGSEGRTDPPAPHTDESYASDATPGAVNTRGQPAPERQTAHAALHRDYMDSDDALQHAAAALKELAHDRPQASLAHVSDLNNFTLISKDEPLHFVGEECCAALGDKSIKVQAPPLDADFRLHAPPLDTGIEVQAPPQHADIRLLATPLDTGIKVQSPPQDVGINMFAPPLDADVKSAGATSECR